MAYRSVVFALLCIGVSLAPGSCADHQHTSLPDLRETRTVGVAGRFPVDRSALENMISEYKGETFGDRDDIELSLPGSLPNANYDANLYGELVVGDMVLHETYLDEKLNRTVEDTRRVFYSSISILINGKHGLLRIGEITDDPSPMTFPLSFNRNRTITVDSIEDAWTCSGQSVTYRMSDGSVLQMTVQYNAMCVGDRAGDAAGKDFDRVTGRTLHSLGTRGNLDWGCEDVASNYGYCTKLEGYRRELEEVGGNVCIELVSTDSRRCVATKMRIEEVTGAFRELLPYLPNSLPINSFETEFFDRGVQTGVIFPCIN